MKEKQKYLQKRTPSSFRAEELCFPKQVAFIRSKSKRKVACNSRRSGKTYTCAVDLLETASNNPYSNSLYITLSRLNAKRILWRTICDLNTKYRLGGIPNVSELTMAFPNGANIFLAGASDESEIEKFRGMPLILVYIDETQAFRPYVERLINDVLSPALLDYDGTLNMIGTPSPIRVGTFFDAFHKKGNFKGYEAFHWTIFDNPFIEKKSGKKVRQLIDEELERRGVSEDNPTIQREVFGRWVEDRHSLVYQYREEVNNYQDLPDLESPAYTMGIDLGFEDSDAIAVFGYSKHARSIYLLHEFKQRKLTLTELATKILALSKEYPNARKVIDTGGLGKKITEELLFRYKINLEPAEKQRKAEFIELMNDEIRRGLIKVPTDSMVSQEWRLLQWDRSYNPPREDDRFENHLSDACLYAWRAARHYAPRAKEIVPEVNSDEHMSRVWKGIEREYIKKNNQEWWEK